MKGIFGRLAVAGAVLGFPLIVLAQQPPVKIVGIVELSGGGATAGTNFDNGAKLAFKEINAAGGILGRKIDYVSMDTQTNPGVAKGLAAKAVDDGAYVVLGPIFSGSFIVSMAETRKGGDPQLHRRRGGQHHAAGQPVRVPHVVHAGDRDAQARALHQGQGQGQDRSR